jgi:putative ABC transport system permease protein
MEAVSAKLTNFLKERSDQGNADLFLQSLSDQYLRTDFKDGKYQGGGRIVYVRMFALIAVFILLIACINFMNLATARSATRAREVGVRRVVGADRTQLIAQFLGESLMLSFIAGAMAVILVQALLPAFNRVFQLELAFDLSDGMVWAALLLVAVFTGVVAGSYPAFFLSKFRPVQVLKGVTRTGKGALWFRKGMVVAQFAIAAFLIISTLTIYRQMEMVRNKNLGYQKENLLYLPVNGTLWEKYQTVKSELLQLPGVSSISSSNGLVFNWGNNTSGVSWEGKDPEDNILFQTIPTGFDFLETLGAELASGRDFSQAFPADSSNYIINEESARLMGLSDPVGQRLSVNGEEGQIIGVVKDFHVGTLQRMQDPVILMVRPWMNYIYVRLQTDDIQKALTGIEQVIARHNPVYPFEYSFVDQEYEQLYRGEQRISALSRLFAFLSVFVSCLGLFGLASFSAEQRTKEIGIRKVLGASAAQLFAMLSREFLLLVLIGFGFAIPFAWSLMSKWLESFAYRIDLTAWMFLGAGVAALLIALFTVSFQSVRAARSNPVKALKYE